jgi:transcriptional regulator with XRE-family HTH domain
MLVGARLRRLREERGITRGDAGFVIRASESKMSRLETGRVSFKERDVADLLLFYGVTDPDQRADLLAQARDASRPDWWRAYDQVMPGWFQSYVGLEEAATGIRGYEVQFIPGLLQTPEYAEAVIGTAVPTPRPSEIAAAVALRAERQRVLERREPPSVWAVIDESALRRPVADAAVTTGQLRHLLEMARRPNIALQILPLGLGAHPPAGGAFSILRFNEPDLPDVVYVEQLVSALYLDRREHVDQYTRVLDRLSVESLTPQRSVDLIAKLLSDLR